MLYFFSLVISLVPLVTTLASNSTAFINLEETGKTIPQDFFGISSNWINFPGFCGNGSTEWPGQPWFTPLLSNLRPCVDCAGPAIRIMGDGQAPYWGPDWTVKRPEEWGSTASYNVTPSAVEAITRSLVANNGTFVVGLPFQVFVSNNIVSPMNATLAVQMALGTQGVVAGRVPMLFEIGNEPDWDSVRSDFYHNENEWEDFWRSYATNLTLHGILPQQIIGGVWASCAWCVNASAYLTRNAPLMGEFNVHWYPIWHGAATGSVSDLLAPSAVSFPPPWQAAAAAAAATGVRFVIREGNNINGGGVSGVSDRFAAALWALDAIFSAAELGVSAWHPNTGTTCAFTASGYCPFCGVPSDPPSPTNAMELAVRGEFYGMVAGARAALGDGGGGARLLNVSMAEGNDPRVTLHALRRASSAWDGGSSTTTSSSSSSGGGGGGGGDMVVVVAVNKNLVSAPGQKDPPPAATTRLTLCLPNSTSAYAETLSAQGGAGATTGIALAGQTWVDGSPSGIPTGGLVRTPLAPVPLQGCSAPGSQAYALDLPAESAVVVYSKVV